MQIPLLLLFLPVIQAFTNGTLLPNYMCDAGRFGYPSSLGGVLASFKISGSGLIVAGFHNQNNIIPQKNLIRVRTIDNTSIITSHTTELVLETVNGENIDGCIIYATDINGNRLGKFVSYGDNMQYFRNCISSPNSVAVHNMVLSETSIYHGLKWKIPRWHRGKVIFTGLTVSDTGFGPFTSEFENIFELSD